MANLKFMNTLTHDEYEPFVCGFSLSTYRNDEGDRIVEHNGFENIDKQTIKDFEAIVAMMKIQLAVKEASSKNKLLDDKGEQTMNKERLEQLLNECIGYLYELKERESKEEVRNFWKSIIGMTDDELEHFGLKEK